MPFFVWLPFYCKITCLHIHFVRPHLKYAGVVWNPYASVDVNLLEAIQNRAAHWICATWDLATYSWSKSSRTCLKELMWPSLAQHRTYFIVDYLHSILHKMNSFSFHDYFTCNSAPTRSHRLTIRPIHSSINAYRFSFFRKFYFSVEPHTL